MITTTMYDFFIWAHTDFFFNLTLLIIKEERLRKWKEYFKNLQENSPEVTDKPFQKINSQLNIKLGQFMKESDAVMKKN